MCAHFPLCIHCLFNVCSTQDHIIEEKWMTSKLDIKRNQSSTANPKGSKFMSQTPKHHVGGLCVCAHMCV